MACVPYLFLGIFVVIEVELGLSFYFLCSLNFFFSTCQGQTLPYLNIVKNFILTLYVALSSSYVYVDILLFLFNNAIRHVIIFMNIHLKGEYTRELSFVSLSRLMHWQSLKITFTLHGRILLEHNSVRNTSFFFLFADSPRTSPATPLRKHRVIIIKSLISLLNSIELLKK